MKPFTLFFVVASACSVLATPIAVGSGLEARSPLEEAREVCDLQCLSYARSFISSTQSPAIQTGSGLPKAHLLTGNGRPSRIHLLTGDAKPRVHLPTGKHSDERAGPSRYIYLIHHLSFVVLVFNLHTESHL
ncbi:uncharacterized protein EDB93DRAFT_701421 [Suillus bovinus]|uniref:uncharacterized protein n=1 Tax=Suillus bovinus TaxID=48563 RepID=UPI001B86170E|nr:uncharacterized protein EDB93DRAFT_701421 [Suillus bovinus]KAG2139141.1 hypothetical protein EDB93DRAFT_701421 [Suillus bovinus]